MQSGIRKAAVCAAFLCSLAHGARAQEEASELARALERAECTLGAECERWGPLIEDDGGTEATCLASAAPPAALVWYRTLPSPDCPFARCELYDQRLILDADGALITLGSVQLPSQDWRNEGGLWFTRHARAGEPLGSVLWDFSAPPPGLEVARHAALLRDGAGRALFVSSRAVLPFDAPRPLQASWFARSARPATGAPAFSTPKGWGVTAALGASGEWVVGAQRRLQAGGAQASVTRYGRSGRALWSRSMPAGSVIEAVHVTPERAILVLAQTGALGERTLYKLDARGAVAWRRALTAGYEPPRVVAVGDGSIYVAALLEEAYFSPAIVIEKLAPNGRGTARWLISEQVWVEPTLVNDESGNAVLALPGFTDEWLPTLDWYAFGEGDACQRTSYAWPSVSSGPPERVLVQADRRGARFFATLQMVGQLREGGQP